MQVRHHQDWDVHERKRASLGPLATLGIAVVAAITGGVSGAIGGAVQDTLQPSLQAETTELLEANLPMVGVSYTEQESFGRMWVPPSALSADEMNTMAQLDPRKQIERVIELGGFHYGGTVLELQLTGTKTKEVRIKGIRHTSECAPVSAGSMAAFQGEIGAAGGGGVITQAELNVEDPYSDLQEVVYKSYGGEKTTHPYFQVNNLTIKKGEMKVFRITAYAENQLCRTSFNIIVTSDEGDQSIPVFSDGYEMVVGPRVGPSSGQIHNAYLGGRLCSGFEEVPSIVMHDDISSASCPTDDQAQAPLGSVPSANPTSDAVASPTPKPGQSGVSAFATPFPVAPAPSSLATPVPTQSSVSPFDSPAPVSLPSS